MFNIFTVKTKMSDSSRNRKPHFTLTILKLALKVPGDYKIGMYFRENYTGSLISHLALKLFFLDYKHFNS